MIARALFLATALLASCATHTLAQTRNDVIAAPALRANVQVSGDLVRIGDIIDNAGSAGQIAIYRAPDLGTTGSLPVAQVLNTLRAHHVIGVDTRDLREISVTRLARTLESKDIELQVARALERRNGLGDAANLSMTFDRDPGDVRLEASFTGGMQATIVRYDNRNGRFDITFEIASENGAAPTKLRFTGTAVETVEAAVLARSVERNEVIKSSDVVVERRPKAEVGADAAPRDRVVGMQARRQLRAGQAIRTADLAKPDLVQRDQNVTLIYEAAGLYLTVRGKALENGTEGDAVNVMNLQSKRTVSGTVIGRGQVAITGVPSRPAQTSDAAPSLATPVAGAASVAGAVPVASAAPVAVATVNSQVAPKAE
jgi:flagella basal body P-ring formation protein FlgA